MDPLKMCFLLEMPIFHYYVSLPEGTLHITNLESLFDLYFWTQKQGRTSKQKAKQGAPAFGF